MANVDIVDRSFTVKRTARIPKVKYVAGMTWNKNRLGNNTYMENMIIISIRKWNVYSGGLVEEICSAAEQKIMAHRKFILSRVFSSLSRGNTIKLTTAIVMSSNFINIRK